MIESSIFNISVEKYDDTKDYLDKNFEVFPQDGVSNYFTKNNGVIRLYGDEPFQMIAIDITDKTKNELFNIVKN